MNNLTDCFCEMDYSELNQRFIESSRSNSNTINSQIRHGYTNGFKRLKKDCVIFEAYNLQCILIVIIWEKETSTFFKNSPFIQNKKVTQVLNE